MGKQMSRGAEIFAGLGTTREIAREIGKSAGLIGGWRTGNGRPSREDAGRIEARWPQCAVELWDTPPRSRAEEGDDDEEDSAAGDPLESTVDGANDAERIRSALRRDLARLEGPAGDRLEPGARATSFKKLADAMIALDRAGAHEMTVQQVLSSSGGQELIGIITRGLRHLPSVVWAIEHAVRSLTTGKPSADLLPLHMRMADIECRSCGDRRHAEAEAPPTELIEACAMAHGCAPRQLLLALDVTAASLRAADAWRARQERLLAHPERYREPETWPLPSPGERG